MHINSCNDSSSVHRAGEEDRLVFCWLWSEYLLETSSVVFHYYHLLRDVRPDNDLVGETDKKEKMWKRRGCAGPNGASTPTYKYLPTGKLSICCVFVMDDSGLYLNVDCIQRTYDYNSHELVLEQSGSSGVEHYVAGSLGIARQSEWKGDFWDNLILVIHWRGCYTGCDRDRVCQCSIFV